MNTSQTQPVALAQYANVRDDLDATLAELEREDVVARIWAKDYTLWKPDPHEISNRLGCFTVAETMLMHVDSMVAFAEEVRGAGYKDAVLLGMGGSSLAPEVMRETFGRRRGYPRLHVLDSTVPAWVRRVTRAIDPARTLFIVSSKSGGTIEVMSFFKHFWSLVADAIGERAGENFVAITDAGTSLEQLAEERRFRRVFRNPSDIGGRYSAQSYFGMVPAVVMGVDVRRLLQRVHDMAGSCNTGVPIAKNPGARLGAALGGMAREGRNKVTFITSPRIASFGLWAEQLIAESTGKEGRGILPIALEPFGPPSVYGNDRVFAYLRLEGDHNDEADQHVAALEAAGQPVIRLTLQDPYDIGAEWYRWEFATAVAGSLININPFDQPNVQESKDNTAQVLQQVEQSGQLPETDTTGKLKELLAQAQPGDYLALQVYLDQSPALDRALQTLREVVLHEYHLPNTMGYGPRFLHSTGQFHKGGPNNGLFVQFVADWGEDVPIPDERYSFAKLVAAQIVGDYNSLSNHGRRVIRIQLGKRPTATLKRLAADIKPRE